MNWNHVKSQLIRDVLNKNLTSESDVDKVLKETYLAFLDDVFDECIPPFVLESRAWYIFHAMQAHAKGDLEETVAFLRNFWRD